MGKAEVNQEIVLMRPIVRKARVRIIRNLIREINILKVKRGDEKKLIKFKRRADRFKEEVEAAKKIKDDEVSNFGLVNSRSLYSILDDPTSDAHTRVIAKFADFPEMKQRIAEFKQKFSDYEQFLGPGRKKLARLEYEKRADFIEEKRQKQLKEKEQKKKLKEVVADSSEDNTDDEIDDNVGEEEKQENEDEQEEGEQEEESEDYGEDENSGEIEEESECKLPLQPNSKSKNIRESKPQSKSENTSESGNKEKLTKHVPRPSKKEKSLLKRKAEKMKSCESETEEEDPVSKKSNKKVSESRKNPKIMINKIAPIIAEPPRKRKLNTKEIRTVTDEATVKRFSDFLQEEAQELQVEISEKVKTKSKTQKEEVEKEVDSFFMTADGSQEYLRVVVPKKIENTNLPHHNLEHANPQEGTDFIRNRSSKNNTSFTNINKFEERPNKFRGDNTWPKNNPGSKFGPRMEKRGCEKNNPRDRNNAHSKLGPRAEKGRGNEARSAEKFVNKFQKKSVASDEHLHPSWAAKKKQQDALKLGFQGKKIVFGD